MQDAASGRVVAGFRVNTSSAVGEEFDYGYDSKLPASASEALRPGRTLWINVSAINSEGQGPSVRMGPYQVMGATYPNGTVYACRDIVPGAPNDIMRPLFPVSGVPMVLQGRSCVMSWL